MIIEASVMLCVTPLQICRKKLRQQYVAQNTAKMNINQVEAKTKEIQAGYGEIQREQMEIRRQIEEAEADHSKIAEELKLLSRMRKNWRVLLRQSSQNWMNGKKKRRKSPGS